MRHFIGYLGKGEVEEYYNALTTELHEKFGIRNLSLRVPPHLTLKYPFETDDAADTESRMKEFLTDKPTFPFFIKGFGRFDDNNKTIFLSVTQNDALSAFVEDCIVSLGDMEEKKKFDAKKFHIHMSVARHLDDDLSEQIWKYVSTLPPPYFEMLFDNLTLFVQENERWKVQRTFVLK